MATTISGKIYRFGDNGLHAETFSLNFVDPYPSWEYTVGPNPSWEHTIGTQRLDRPTAVRFAGPIGLDGLFRKSSSTTNGIDAVKRSWLDDHTFVVERRILGHADTQKWTLAFEGKKVDATFESTDGANVKLHGEADE